MEGGRSTCLVLLLLLSIAGSCHSSDAPFRISDSPSIAPEAGDGRSPGMLATLSQAGLIYAKDILVTRVLQEIVPLQIPDVKLSESTTIGTISVELTDILLKNVSVPEAAIALDSDGITIFGEGAEANMTFSWAYNYASLLGDKGTATVKVKGMQAGVLGNLTEANGTLTLGIVQHGVVIEELDIKMHGGFSWAYNWLIYGFTNHLRAAVESSVGSGMLKAALKLDTFLQNLPRQVVVDDVAAIDTTLVEDPIVSTDHLSFGPRGEFVRVGASARSSSHAPPFIPDGVACGETQKMVTIALSDFVVNSAAKVYYEAGTLEYEVDKLPETSIIKLNTGSWRFLVPQLYRQYPNQPLALQFSAASVPVVQFTATGVVATVEGDMFITVVPASGEDTTRVACLSLSGTLQGFAQIVGNNLTGTAQVDDISLSLKWSTIGNFPVRTLQVVVRTLVKTLLLPVLNLSLQKGFPIPLVPGVAILNAGVTYGDKYLLVCTDIEYTGNIFGNRRSSDTPLDAMTDVKLQLQRPQEERLDEEQELALGGRESSAAGDAWRGAKEATVAAGAVRGERVEHLRAKQKHRDDEDDDEKDDDDKDDVKDEGKGKKDDEDDDKDHEDDDDRDAELDKPRKKDSEEDDDDDQDVGTSHATLYRDSVHWHREGSTQTGFRLDRMHKSNHKKRKHHHHHHGHDDEGEEVGGYVGKFKRFAKVKVRRLRKKGQSFWDGSRVQVA